jgi:spore germination protein KC
MKRTIIGIAFMLLLVSFTGCKKNYLPERREIDDLQLVQVVGIDKLSDDTNDCMITIASKKLEEGGGGSSSEDTGKSTGSDSAKALVLTAKGKTIFDAVRNIQTHSDKTIFWGHAEYYLIGEEAAKENIIKYLDFFTRDHELRIESKVYIVKDSTAKDFIEQFNESSDYYIHDKLEILGQNLKLLGTSQEMKIHELMRFIDIHHASARIPCVYLITRDSGKKNQVKDLEIYGYAIISNNKLEGFLGTDISRGLNLITNTIESSIVTVKDLAGQDASLEIIDSSTEVIPFFNGDTLERITLKTKVTSNIGELQSLTDITTEESISYLESQQSEILKNEMERVLEKVVEFKSDCLEICDKIRLRKPLKWRKIESQWMEIMLNVKTDVQVESKIRRTYDLREPSGYQRLR